MRSVEALKRLTPEDTHAHLQEISRLRCCLFRQRQPAQCFVIGPGEIVAPSVLVLVDLVTGRPIRTLLRGGLRHEFRFPHATGPRWITVQHWDGERYWLHASFQDDSKPAEYTRFSKEVMFKVLEQEFLSCIDRVVLECRPRRPLRPQS